MQLAGPRLVLRNASAADAPRLTSIRGEPEIERRWGVLEEGEMDEFVADEHTFVIEADGEVIGAVQYGEVDDPMYRSANIDLYLTTPRHGQGLGSEAVRILARHLIEERGHHRLTIDPAADNAAAIRAYEKVGFRPGRDHALLRAGARRDVPRRAPDGDARGASCSRTATRRDDGSGDPRDVDRWLRETNPTLEPALRRVTEVILAADARLTAYLKNGTVQFAYEGDMAAFVQPKGTRVSLMFYRGAKIPGTSRISRARDTPLGSFGSTTSPTCARRRRSSERWRRPGAGS